MSGYVYSGTDRLDESDQSTCFGARGTVAGWHRHRKVKEKPCDKCREAYNAYHRKLRANDPKHKARTKTYVAAKQRAFRALARRYAAEFRVIFQQELAAAQGSADVSNSPATTEADRGSA